MSERRSLTHVAKRLRRDMTDAERVLWRELRAHRFEGFKFKRQEPLGPYVVDFICHAARLVVEIDGGQHADQGAADLERTHWLESQGFRVLRFWNNDVFANIEGVMRALEKELRAAVPPAPPLPGPLPRGERES
jgi:very-short-patch-repair endonuclease